MPKMMYRANTEISIDPSARQLHFIVGGQVVKTYPIAVGTNATPTPAGDYTVITKTLQPGGILGTRWMGLSIPGGNYGIHGTSYPPSIGTKASHGCIRMFNENVEELFPQVAIGTPVHIEKVSGYNDWFNPDASGTSYSQGPPLDNSSYVVQPGDTLWKISQKFNVPLEQLIAANQLSNPNQLKVGQSIFIPK